MISSASAVVGVVDIILSCEMLRVCNLFNSRGEGDGIIDDPAEKEIHLIKKSDTLRVLLLWLPLPFHHVQFNDTDHGTFSKEGSYE
ncbi:MAG: hypothetical protein WBD25_03395 [Terriglobales bacterium]|jgi:hypothetical protein